MIKRRRFLMNAAGVSTALYGLSIDSSAKSPEPAATGSIGNVLDPTYIDPRLDSRSLSAENPNGARGAGGREGDGRKGKPGFALEPGNKLVLADLSGPGTLRHIWMASIFGSPEVARALRFEVFYDGMAEPSVSVPILDFFGLPHGRTVEYYSALTSVQEGLGLNSHIPMPFARSIRVELANESKQKVSVVYQIDYTLEPARESPSYLHVTFRRENPTTLRRDFLIAGGLKGPGRFLGCSVGIRVLDTARWYGEGEVKIYRDGDRDFPTYCGTGLEDYVGSAMNLARHYGPYAGAPLNIPEEANAHALGLEGIPMPNFASFYRWHLPDPIMFASDLRVTIQQIGAAVFVKGQEAEFEAYKRQHSPIRGKWTEHIVGNWLASALLERSDDYCATAYIYCQHPQPVARFSTDVAVLDLGLPEVSPK